MPSPTVIAIDGPSASGKGTIAKKLAVQYRFAHLDTGLLYRAVGLAMVGEHEDPSDAAAAERAARALSAADIGVFLANPALRTDKASNAASKVAAVPGVRAALLKFQKDFCAHPPDGKTGAVLDGRDIGTVIAPNAKVKIYVTASAEARAARRFKELKSRGEPVTEADVLQDMQERDARDSGRGIAPLKPAPDAVTLDTTNISADEAFREALQIVKSKLGR